MERLDVYRRDVRITLSDEQWARLRRIWSTDRCPRRVYHRIMGHDELPIHFMSFRGSVGHKLIEKTINGEPFDEEYETRRFPEARDAVLRHYEPITDNLRMWIETTKFDLSEAESEIKYEKELELDYVLVRKLDMNLPEHIVDFKFGKKRNTMDARIDLAHSRELRGESGDGWVDPANLLLVFLGGDEPDELYPFQNKRTPYEPALEAAQEMVRKQVFHRERIKAGEVPPCETSFFCGMCPYRHVCRGF